MNDVLQLTANEPLSFASLSIALMLGFCLSFAASWHYKNFGHTLANRSELARILPFICVTTILIITIVKSSLALSLGLVGALSIVRFRTPIKEPEELAYLFFAIAIGLGLGASQFFPTIIATAIIIALISITRLFHKNESSKNINLWISINETQNLESEIFLNTVQKILVNQFPEIEIGSIMITNQKYEYGCKILTSDLSSINMAISDIKAVIPEAEFNFLDESRITGL